MKDARQIIIRPIVSEKSYALIEQNRYTFEVDKERDEARDRHGGRGDLQRDRDRA